MTDHTEPTTVGAAKSDPATEPQAEPQDAAAARAPGTTTEQPRSLVTTKPSDPRAAAPQDVGNATMETLKMLESNLNELRSTPVQLGQ